MTDMTAEEIDGLPPVEQSQLTAAELDEIIADHAECGWEGDEGCPHCKMARELRALRADRWDWERVEAAVEINKRVAKLRAENAKLAAALQEIMDTDCVAGETPFQVEQRFHAIAHRAWHGALASVKGE